MEESFRRTVEQVRNAHGLQFAALLPADRITEAFESASVVWLSRLFTPAHLVWTFLGQCLNPDHSCRDAVQRLLGWLAALGRKTGSAATGAYCLARDRLPESVCRTLLRETGRHAEQAAPPEWSWRGRRVLVADGTTLTMPDTPANQAAYPQPRSQRPGCGFPIVRMVVLFTLSIGTVVESAVSPYTGKRTGENSLLRTLVAAFEPGDVLLADRYFSGWFDIMWWRRHGVDVVIRKHQLRRTDFRTGRRLGIDDHLVEWPKPPRPEWMSRDEYDAMPNKMTLRELRVVSRPGFRSWSIVMVTSLLDTVAFPATEITQLYRRRWSAELNLRSLKSVMQMDHLRCLTPHRVRNEITMHLIAYNLIREMMATAASAVGREPWEVSFKATLQTICNLLPLLNQMAADDWCDLLFRLIATDCVGDRPDRYEPRVKKRRPKPYALMNRPRREYPTP